MRAFVITLAGDSYNEKYSQLMAQRCIGSAADHGIKVERFDATPQHKARDVMDDFGLRWAWPGKEPEVCAVTGLTKRPYRTPNPGARIGCAMSHYRLWQEVAGARTPIMILEHDAVFLRPLPELPAKFGAVMLNNPDGVTPRGEYWRDRMVERGPGVFTKTEIFQDGRPDGLAGNSAYVISPQGAARCISLYHSVGVWPNDATLCRQLVDGLFEVYPFVTEARQTVSMSGGY